MDKKKTKIVASISDDRCEVNFLQQLYDEGMNVVRMNTAHADPDGLRKIIRNTRMVSNRIGILIDTKGPEVRTTVTDTGSIEYTTGERVKISGDPTSTTTHDHIFTTYTNLVQDVQIGSSILFDDGELAFAVESKTDDALIIVAQNDGTLGNRKSINLPGTSLTLPSITDKDISNIHLAIEEGIDFIAHSFVRSKQDVLAVQEILDQERSDIRIIAKIENQEGINNIDEILDVAYGIMVARGDLGIEVPVEQIPGIQRMLIEKCIKRGKPVIVATQMLHSMITNPRPTRAEVTDVANAVFSHADAVMLSGETAYGKYPVEAVRTMASIAIEAERVLPETHDIKIALSDKNDFSEFLAKQAVKASKNMAVRAIITDSHTGQTARFVAAFHPKSPTLALCYNEQTLRSLSLSYGVIPVYQSEKTNARGYFFASLYTLMNEGLLCESDKVAYLSGSYECGGTTFLELNTVSNILSGAGEYQLPTFHIR